MNPLSQLSQSLSKEIAARLEARQLNGGLVDSVVSTGSLMLLRSLSKNLKLLVEQNKDVLSYNKRQMEAVEGMLGYLKERDKPRVRPVDFRG